MTQRKGLIGLFSTIFLLSAISMVMLVLDDRKDLSSRASIGLSSNLRPALPGIKFVPNEIVWDGAQYKLPVIVNYNSALWLPPKDNNIVFYHAQLPITLRVTTAVIDKSTLEKILGPNFTASKVLNGNNLSVPGWTIQNYQYLFFGQKKSVDVWHGKNKITLITVKPEGTTNIDIEDFVSSLVYKTGNGLVKGVSSPDETVRLAALIRPSVVMILNNYCSKVKFAQIPDFVLAGREYPFCYASVGSGFFVNKNGYIATNGHVVKNAPDTSLFYSVASGGLDTLLADYMQVYLAQTTGMVPERAAVDLKVKEAHANKENIYQLAALVKDLVDRKFLAVSNSENKYFVQLGNTPLQLTKAGVVLEKGIIEAKLIGSDYSEPDKVTGFSSSDVAILKIDGSNYPGLPLGSSDDLSVGSSIQIIGFPGIVMGSNSFLLDTSANAEPTFTKGVVSAIKLAKGDRKKLIQTDASINHGNSGGPAISSDGKVVGIATYGLTPEEGSGNYNFLRDIQDLKALMTKNNITEDPGETYTLWKSGLDSYWLSYFQYAKSDFEKITSLYPIHPSVEKYLAVAKTKINTPEDQTPKFTRSERSGFMTVSGGVMALSLILIIVLSIMDRMDYKKRQALTVDSPPLATHV